jgi:hypothetical protein
MVDTGGKPWAMNISANFWKNSKRPQWYTQGLGGNWFMKKNQKSKISWHCPFKKCNCFKLPSLISQAVIYLLLWLKRIRSSRHGHLNQIFRYKLLRSHLALKVKKGLERICQLHRMCCFSSCPAVPLNLFVFSSSCRLVSAQHATRNFFLYFFLSLSVVT